MVQYGNFSVVKLLVGGKKADGSIVKSLAAWLNFVNCEFGLSLKNINFCLKFQNSLN